MAIWVKYFALKHKVLIFSEKEDYLGDSPVDDDVTIIESEGYLGGALNRLRVKSHSMFHINKLISVRRYAREIENVVAESHIDIIHAYSLYSGYVASFINVDVPIIFTPLGSSLIIHAQNNLLYKLMAKRAFSHADIVTNDSLILQTKGYNLGADRQHNYIVQNGVDSRVFYPKANGIKATYGIKQSDTLIFSPRGLDDLYNIDVILASLQIIKKQGLSFKCMFSFAFGESSLEKLKILAHKLDVEDDVIWLGCLTYDEMAVHYNAADIVVSVPSSDSSPKSVYEAMFCKKPIVVTNLKWSHEILHDCILRVEVRSATQLASAIQYLVNNPESARKLSSNALKCAKSHFDYVNNMAEMEKIMIGALNHSI